MNSDVAGRKESIVMMELAKPRQRLHCCGHFLSCPAMHDFDAYDTLSFDCYGTLIDWEAGIAAALRPWASRSSLELTDEELIAAHARHETLVQQAAPTASYPEILGDTLRRIGDELGAPVSDDDAAAFGASVGDWPAFEDSAEALQRLKERYKLVILSNIDRASLAASRQRLQVDFDLVVTAEEVGSYKPDLRNFDFMFARLSAIGSERSKLLHVAESLYHDHEPSKKLGLPSVWIRRRHGKQGLGATAEPSRPVRPRWRYDSLAAFAEDAAGSA